MAPTELGFRLDDVAAWVRFLGLVGVVDGLPPIDVTLAIDDMDGWQWSSKFSSAVALPAADHERWDPSVHHSADQPRFPNTLYRIAGKVMRLPTSGEYADLPQAARETFGRLVVAGLATWDDDVLTVRVARPRSGAAADPVEYPSPVTEFLRSMPGSRDPTGSAGPGGLRAARRRMALSRQRQRGAAHLHAAGRHAHPPPARPLRYRGARLRTLGLNVWNERADSIRRLLALASAYQRLDVADTLLANFRKAYERTWTLVVRGAGAEPPASSGPRTRSS